MINMSCNRLRKNNKCEAQNDVSKSETGKTIGKIVHRHRITSFRNSHNHRRKRLQFIFSNIKG